MHLIMSTNKQSKGTPLDAQMRVNRILQMLAEGKSRTQIQAQIIKEFGVAQSTVNADFIKALAELKKNQEPFTTEIRAVIADRYEVLWDKALEKNDLKTAAIILKQESDLFGLNVQKQDVEVSTGEFVVEFN